MDTSKIISCTKTIAGRKVTLETGKVARQATASVIASSGDTQVLVTVVAGGQKPGQSFFPLTVNYIEKFYACLLYTSPSPRDLAVSRMPSSA